LCLNFGEYGCESGPVQPSGDFDIHNLFQTWTHSYEEEQSDDGFRLFRSAAAMTFAPSRFRMQYVFSENGNCEWLYLDPADAHHLKPAKWKVDPNDGKVILIYDLDGALLEFVSFRIIKLEKDVLKIAQIDL
jgi:hypothetical protein